MSLAPLYTHTVASPCCRGSTGVSQKRTCHLQVSRCGSVHTLVPWSPGEAGLPWACHSSTQGRWNNSGNHDNTTTRILYSHNDGGVMLDNRLMINSTRHAVEVRGTHLLVLWVCGLLYKLTTCKLPCARLGQDHRRWANIAMHHLGIVVQKT